MIRRELRQSADWRSDLADDAVEQYLARMEALLAANWPKVIRGDARSTEQCRRMLDSMAKVQGLVPSLTERVLLIRDDEDDDDELEAWRKRREQPGYVGSYAGPKTSKLKRKESCYRFYSSIATLREWGQQESTRCLSAVPISRHRARRKIELCAD